MYHPSKFEVELIEKIIRAKIKLENSKKKWHLPSCQNNDCEMVTKPCNCGFVEHNIFVDEVISTLEINATEK
jgi:hypothetical protein